MEQKKQDPYLFILLGFDTLYSINLKHLLKEEEDLRIVFSHKTTTLSKNGDSYRYPLGMGLFVHDSKLHFFGGENIKPDCEDGFQNIEFEIRRQPPEDLDYPLLDFLCMPQPRKNWDEWINKKVFSFTPILKLDELVPSNSSPPLIPDPPSSYKMRPIVFTFSDKVYALATRPFSGSLVDAGIKEEQDLFEVFEPIDGKWQWTTLPNPPARLSKLIHGSIPIGLSRSKPIFHCVVKKQLLLQTRVGDYIFDLIDRKWFRIPKEDHDIILASLEYKGQQLLFFGGGYLVAFDLKSFKEYERGLSFWSSSFGAIWEETIFNVGCITEGSCIWGASLSIVDDNSICLVFNGYEHLYVCHFEFIKPPCKFHLKAHNKFHLPTVMQADPYNLSSFIL